MTLSEYFAATYGAQAALAKASTTPAPLLSQWASGARPVPVDRCAQLEATTGRQVMRWDLRPDDWYRHWPELIGADGAPAIPQSEPKAA